MPTDRIRLQRIVLDVAGGVVYFDVPDDPHYIVTNGTDFTLTRRGSPMPSGFTSLCDGYRYTPTHGEWALLLREHCETEWYDDLLVRFSRLGSVGRPDLVFPIGRTQVILTEPNRMRWKGGSELQVSAYLSSDSSTFSWKPTPPELELMLSLAFDLYGWHGDTGLEREIFSKVKVGGNE